MPTRDTPFAAGTPCWVDLMSSDTDRSRAFYGDLFGWTFTDPDPDYGSYSVAQSDGHAVAGLMPKPAGSPMPDVWSTYISTDDIGVTVDKARANGGQVVHGPDTVGPLGSMAVLLDPSGAATGLWQPGLHTGFGRYNEYGAVTWDELASKDFSSAKAFYELVFGWTYEVVSDSEEMRYVTIHVDGDVVGGLMDAAHLPPEVPSHWAVYFSVESTDDAAAQAEELGATVVMPAASTEHGRMAWLTDPTGAAFNLHQPPPSA